MADLKTRLIQLLDLSRSFQQQLIADLDLVERNAHGTWANWSLKDELAHVVAWQMNALARIAALMHAEPPPNFDDYETINRAVYETNRDRPLAEIAAEGDRAYADFVALIQSLPEEDLAHPEQRSVITLIMGNGYEHPVAHYANHYQRRGRLDKAVQLVETSAAAVADLPAWYGAARYNLACFYALNGQTDKALIELREALRLRTDLLEWSKEDTDLASLRGDPAYQALYAA